MISWIKCHPYFKIILFMGRFLIAFTDTPIYRQYSKMYEKISNYAYYFERFIGLLSVFYVAYIVQVQVTLQYTNFTSSW
jgi:hypothetical protein